MKLFRKLAVASTGATFLLVAIGGLVRATKSGLGCGDNWPHCPGEIDRALLIESSHRAVAGIVIALIAAMVVTAWRNRAEAGRLLPLSVLAFSLVMSQALIGALVVWLHLDAEAVILHLGTAMSLVALLIHITLQTRPGESPAPASDAALYRRAWFAAGSVLFLLLVGSYVTGKDAGYVFPDWPLMNGAVIPDLGHELYAIHFFHRALAGVVAVIVAAVCIPIIRRKDAFPLQARLAHAALGLYAVEIVIGAVNVFTELNAAAVTAHLAIGAFIWGSLATLAMVTRPAVSERAGKPIGSRSAALEGGR